MSRKRRRGIDEGDLQLAGTDRNGIYRKWQKFPLHTTIRRMRDVHKEHAVFSFGNTIAINLDTPTQLDGTCAIHSAVNTEQLYNLTERKAIPIDALGTKKNKETTQRKLWKYGKLQSDYAKFLALWEYNPGIEHDLDCASGRYKKLSLLLYGNKSKVFKDMYGKLTSSTLKKGEAAHAWDSESESDEDDEIPNHKDSFIRTNKSKIKSLTARWQLYAASVNMFYSTIYLSGLHILSDSDEDKWSAHAEKVIADYSSESKSVKRVADFVTDDQWDFDERSPTLALRMAAYYGRMLSDEMKRMRNMRGTWQMQNNMDQDSSEVEKKMRSSKKQMAEYMDAIELAYIVLSSSSHDADRISHIIYLSGYNKKIDIKDKKSKALERAKHVNWKIDSRIAGDRDIINTTTGKMLLDKKMHLIAHRIITGYVNQGSVALNLLTPLRELLDRSIPKDITSMSAAYRWAMKLNYLDIINAIERDEKLIRGIRIPKCILDYKGWSIPKENFVYWNFDEDGKARVFDDEGDNWYIRSGRAILDILKTITITEGHRHAFIIIGQTDDPSATHATTLVTKTMKKNGHMEVHGFAANSGWRGDWKDGRHLGRHFSTGSLGLVANIMCRIGMALLYKQRNGPIEVKRDIQYRKALTNAGMWQGELGKGWLHGSNTTPKLVRSDRKYSGDRYNKYVMLRRHDWKHIIIGAEDGDIGDIHWFALSAATDPRKLHHALAHPHLNQYRYVPILHMDKSSIGRNITITMSDKKHAPAMLAAYLNRESTTPVVIIYPKTHIVLVQFVDHVSRAGPTQRQTRSSVYKRREFHMYVTHNKRDTRRAMANARGLYKRLMNMLVIDKKGRKQMQKTHIYEPIDPYHEYHHESCCCLLM